MLSRVVWKQFNRRLRFMGLEDQDYFIIGMNFGPVLTVTATGSLDPEVEVVGRTVRGEHPRSSSPSSSCSYSTRKGPHKFNLEQGLNDSATSTASPSEHRTFYAHIAFLDTKFTHRIFIKAHIIRVRQIVVFSK